jgi:SAM-dependent methyltransferase
MLDTTVTWLLCLVPSPALRRRLSFTWRYRRGALPWDTGETPPEVKAFVAGATPGRALDLGCGTGTNVLYLADYGWQIVGVDFVEQAVEQARRKAAGRDGVTFFQGDVTHLEQLPLYGPFDYLLDIGCLHSLTEEGQQRYAVQLARLARPGGCYMLYASQPRPSSTGQIGISPEAIAALFAPSFTVERQLLGDDSGGGWASGWYWLRRK